MPILGSLAHAPKDFPRPLVKEIGATVAPSNDGIDWGAAACAYEYYFAVIYHFAQQGSIADFLMINEPENRFGQWYVTDDPAKLGWGELFCDDEDGVS